MKEPDPVQDIHKWGTQTIMFAMCTTADARGRSWTEGAWNLGAPEARRTSQDLRDQALNELTDPDDMEEALNLYIDKVLAWTVKHLS